MYFIICYIFFNIYLNNIKYDNWYYSVGLFRAIIYKIICKIWTEELKYILKIFNNWEIIK
jgi:hypothetical protein